MTQTAPERELVPRANTDGLRVFDLPAGVEYLKSIGATAATNNFLRSLIASSQIAHLRIGRRFYVSKAALDHWISTRERRGH